MTYRISCILMAFSLTTCTWQLVYAEDTDSAPMYVDSKAIKDRFSTITAEDMDMLRGKKILFASRSFGLNTCGGLSRLAKEDKKYDMLSSFKRFDVSRAKGDLSIVPPDILAKVNFVHVGIDHWPLTKRVDQVEQLVRNANFGKTADVVFLFYCDARPDCFDYYSKKMDAMRADFPNVKFIYACSGFHGAKYADNNAAAQAFSEKVRQRYKGVVPLFDMGKILSDDFRCGHVFCPEYSTDTTGGHPSSPAGEMALAKGFLLVLRDAFRAQPGKTVKPN